MIVIRVPDNNETVLSQGPGFLRCDQVRARAECLDWDLSLAGRFVCDVF